MSIEYIASWSPQRGLRVMYCGVPNSCSQEAGEKLMPKRTSELLHRQAGKETITVKTGSSCGFSDCGKTHPSSQDILSLLRKEETYGGFTLHCLTSQVYKY